MEQLSNDPSRIRGGFAVTADHVHEPMCWPAVFAGAIAAAALSLILLALGSGLGLSSVSPWAYAGVSAPTLGVGVIVWLLLMAAIASGLGGYLAGRLRAKWRDADYDETYFRDTAHGFLAWGVATLLSAAVLTSAASSMVGTAVTGAGAIAGAGAAAAPVAATTMQSDGGEAANREGYFTDMLFRGSTATPESGASPSANEARRILGNGLLQGSLSDGDKTYLAQLVAKRTELSQAEAEQRVTQVSEAAKSATDSAKAKAQEVADTARKAAARLALWIFVSMLLGAFSAAYAAMVGGRQRDHEAYSRVGI